MINKRFQSLTYASKHNFYTIAENHAKEYLGSGEMTRKTV